MTSFADDHRESLRRLQEELRTLKEQHGTKLYLRKAAGSGNPFPILIAVTVSRPSAASSYDAESLKIRVQLDEKLLDGEAAGVDVQVVDESLPQRLRSAISDRLQAAWQSTRQGGDGGFGLQTTLKVAEDDFVRLVTAVPELVESYEATNDAGATVRRFAIVNEDQQVSMDVGVHAPQRQPANSQRPAVSGGLSQHAAAPIAAADELPAGTSAALRSELTWLRRRYGAGFRLRAPEAAGCSHTTAAVDQNLQLTVDVAPRDPAWDKAIALRFDISIAASYPAAGSVEVSASSCSSCISGATGSSNKSRGGAQQQQQQGLSEDVAGVLGKLMTAEVAAHANRPGPLKAMLRSVENSAAAHVQQAEDVLHEVARRRRAAAAATGASSADSKAADAGPRQADSSRPTEPAAGIPVSAEAKAQSDDTAAQLQAGVTPALAVPGTAVSKRQAFGAGLWWPSGEIVSSNSGGGQLEQSLEDMRLDGSKSIAGQAAGQQPAERDPLSRTNSYDSDSGSTFSGSDSGSESGSSDDSRDSAQQDAAGRTTAAGLAADDGGARTAIKLELLELSVDNIDVIEPYTLQLQVTCQRCLRRGQVELPAADASAHSTRITVSGACSHCHHDWQVGVRGSMVHEHSAVLARLWPSGCTPVDLLPSLLSAQCGNCSAVAAMRQVQVGQHASRDCSGCHRAMSMRYSAVAFASASAGGGRPSDAAKRPRSQPADAKHAGGGAGGGASPQVGSPLPDLGTCQHYRHSHRWLRFPCCGAAFACDLCHEVNTDGHEMKWANRMICGFCSLEQPLASRCSACDKRLASSANKSLSGAATRHWEGGKGCRDPKRLDRRDARKHRGSRHKTQSQKHKRVGIVAKERRNARQAAA